MRRAGFTLMELMTTVVIIGILASIAIPSFRKAINRSYRREAEDILMTIYHGERAYFIAKGSYYDVNELGGMAEWRKIHMDDPNLGSIPVQFRVSVNMVDPTIFLAEAALRGDWGRAVSVDQNRRWCGGLVCPSWD